MQTIENIKKGLKCHGESTNATLACSDCDWHGQYKPHCRKALHNDAIALIDQLLAEKALTIDAEPVRHGRWLLVGADKRGRGGVFMCTACDRCRPHKSDYCPNCGAKMDGKDIDVPAKPEPLHRPEDCVNYATRTSDGKAVCLGTRELERCEGAWCKQWKAKKNGGAENED